MSPASQQVYGIILKQLQPICDMARAATGADPTFRPVYVCLQTVAASMEEGTLDKLMPRVLDFARSRQAQLDKFEKGLKS